METALNAIERSKSDTNEVFRRLLQSPDAHYASVKLATGYIATATQRRQVLEKPAIVGRYVRLVVIILEHKAHAEHLSCSDWSVFADFLVAAYTGLKRMLQGIELIKSVNELFNGLSLLMRTTESCCEEKFADILETCIDFVNTAGQRETSSHPHIMTCTRMLVQLGHTEARILGDAVVGSGKARNQALAYEMFAYACLQPQSLPIVKSMAPKMIESHEIEFVPCVEFSLPWFRPSGEADLAKFVAARALGLALTFRADELNQLPSSKKFKGELSDQKGLTYMAGAFAGVADENVEGLTEWLSSDSQSQKTTATFENVPGHPEPAGFWRANSPLSSIRKARPADDVVSFWAFVRLAQSVSLMSGAQKISVWNLCIDHLSNVRCSSGACFCLSQIVSSLLLPENIDSYALSKVRSLLNLMGSSSHPALTSGSLILYNMLYGIRVLDDDFQRFKIHQLKAWLQSRIRDGQPRLVTHFLAYECPPAYLQNDIANDLVKLARYTRVHSLVQELSDTARRTQKLPASVNATSPMITALPLIQLASLRDSLWLLALLARAGHKRTLPNQAENDAFTEDDLQAIVWFANLANYFQWNDFYCKTALSMAKWDTPARNVPSVSRAISLLKLPGSIVSSVISGYSSMSLTYSKNPGAELRRLEPFLQSYTFQRSSWFLENMARTLDHGAWKHTNERTQLLKFLVKVALSQSAVASLRSTLLKHLKATSTEDFLNLMKSSSQDIIFETLGFSVADENVAEGLSARCKEIIDTASDPNSRHNVALVLTVKGVMSLAQLLLMMHTDPTNILSLSRIYEVLRIRNSARLFANSAVPLHFASYGCEDLDASAVLRNLGSPNGVIERLECFMRPFKSIRLEMPEGKLAGIAEQILKDVSYCGSDAEIAESIRRAHSFLRAHRPQMSDTLLGTLIQGCCAAITTTSNHSQKRSNAVEAFRNIAEQELENREPTDTFYIVAGCLDFCGAERSALKVLTRISQNTSPTRSLCNLLSDLSVDSLPSLCSEFFELEQDLSFEVSHMVIRYAIKVVEASDLKRCLESCAPLRSSEVENLINWTSYLRLRDSTRWMSFLSKLCGSKGIQKGEIDMETSKFPYNSWLRGTISLGMEAFYDVLLQVYHRIPYFKKWKLHPYFQRDPQVTARGLKYVPDDVFGKELWQTEVEFRPDTTTDYLGPTDLLLQRAEEISNLTSKLWGLPSLGPHIFQEIPELLHDALPYMAAAHYSSTFSETRKPIASTVSAAELEKSVADCFEASETIYIGLRIVDRCYKQSSKSPVGLERVVQACQKYKLLYGHSEFLELGILFAELIWIEAPQDPLPHQILQPLRYFYSSMADISFRDAIPELDNTMAMFAGVRNDAADDPWKKLELSMVQTEALGLPEQSTLDNTFQDAGLWRLANRFANKPKLYDFKKAWWLQEWETLSVPRRIDPHYFENREFGLLVGFFTGAISEEDTFAELLSTKASMIPVFENMLHQEPISKLKCNLEDLPIIRQGREILLTNKDDLLTLGRELKSFCEQCRDNGDLHRSSEYAIKLENLASKSKESSSVMRANISICLQALSCVETANLEWALGRHSAAIERLKALASTADREYFRGDSIAAEPSNSNSSNRNSSNSSSSNILTTDLTRYITDVVDLGIVYSTIGTWSRAARNEPDSAILTTYFLRAEQTISRSGEERLYHEFARFCDDACQDESLEVAIRDSERVKQTQKHQVEYLSKAIQAGTTDKAFQHRYRMSIRMLKAETEDLEKLKERKMDLTLRCIRCYLLSLRAGDAYEQDMDRFIALWLSLSQDAVVSELVHDYFVGTDGATKPSGESGSVLVRKVIPWMNQLSSRLTTKSTQFQHALWSIIEKAAREHPHHTLWQLINILRTKDNANHSAAERKAAAKAVIRRAIQKKSKLYSNLSDFAENMVLLGSASLEDESPKQVLLPSFGTRLSQWWITKLPKMRLPVPTVSLEVRADANYSEVPVVWAVHDSIDIAGGISAPKIITVTDSMGTSHKMVLKGSEKDDLRQDAIMQQVFAMSSTLLQRSSACSESKHMVGLRKLRVRTYNVVPLGGVAGAIEFVRNTKSLQEILEPLHMLHGGREEYSLRRARRTMHANRDSNRAVRIATYEEVMQHTLPQMRRFWPKRFRDPREWLEAKTSWSRSTAIMSILGYIVGLGDRHCSNLLVDTKTGEVVHIDLGIAFDQGKQLYIPETVPFRLTRDMIDGMGVPGTNGVFMSAAKATLQLLREQRDRIMMVLEVLKHDALYTWRLPPIKLNRIQLGSEAEEAGLVDEVPRAERGQAEQALRGVRQKLTASLSSEATVRDLVAQATSTENLALIFSGWSPFY